VESVPRVGSHISPVDEKTIAPRLKEIRKRRGKAQAELATILGVDQTLVSAYERGAVRVHGGIVAAFTKALRTSDDEILGLNDTQTNGIFRDRRFIRRLEKIEKLPKRAKQALLKTIDTYMVADEKR